MHQWQRAWAGTVQEIDLARRVLRDRFQCLQRLQLNIGRVLGDRIVYLCNFVGRCVREDPLSLCFHVGGFPACLCPGHFLLQFRSYAFEFRAFSLDRLLAFLLFLNGLNDKRRQGYVANQYCRYLNSFRREIVSEPIRQARLQLFLCLFFEKVFGALDAFALLSK